MTEPMCPHVTPENRVTDMFGFDWCQACFEGTTGVAAMSLEEALAMIGLTFDEVKDESAAQVIEMLSDLGFDVHFVDRTGRRTCLTGA